MVLFDYEKMMLLAETFKDPSGNEFAKHNIVSINSR